MSIFRRYLVYLFDQHEGRREVGVGNESVGHLAGGDAQRVHVRRLTIPQQVLIKGDQLNIAVFFSGNLEKGTCPVYLCTVATLD